jgi:hypothetical protein
MPGNDAHSAALAAPGRDAVVRGMLERGRASTFKLEPRVELLIRACLLSNLPVNGPATEEDYVYPLSPRSEQLVNYLVGAMPPDPELSKRVMGAVLQYQGAVRVLEVAELQLLAKMLADAHVTALRTALFFLSRFGEQFRHDPMLAQVFPQPQTVQSLPQPQTVRPVPLDAPVTTDPAAAEAPSVSPTLEAPQQPTKRPTPLVPPVSPSRPVTPALHTTMSGMMSPVARGAADPLVPKAETLLAYLAPRMETIRLVNAMFDPTQVGKAGDLMSSAARTARTLGGAIKKQNRPLMGMLAEAYALYVQLSRDQRVFQSQGLSDNSKQNYFKLRVHTMNFLREPLLCDLFPARDKVLLNDA